MKMKSVILLVVGLGMLFGVAATPASAAYLGLPHVGSPDVARVLPFDGQWFYGGYGWANNTSCAAGTPIPSEMFVKLNFEWIDPDKALLAALPGLEFYAVTVKGPDGVVVKTTEEQSAGFFTKVTYDPIYGAWCRFWEVPLGQLPSGDYHVVMDDHQVTTIRGSLWNETTGTWDPPIEFAPFKAIYRSSFTVD